MNYCRALFRLRERKREDRRSSNRFVVVSRIHESFSRFVRNLVRNLFQSRKNRASFVPSFVPFFDRERKKGARAKKKKRNGAKLEQRRYASNVRIMRTNANAVGSERTFICHAVADVHDAEWIVGKGRERARFTTFQTFNSFHGMSSLVRLRSRSIRFPLARISTDLDEDRPCTLPRLSATVISLPPCILSSARCHRTTCSYVASTFLLIIQLYSTFFNDWTTCAVSNRERERERESSLARIYPRPSYSRARRYARRCKFHMNRPTDLHLSRLSIPSFSNDNLLIARRIYRSIDRSTRETTRIRIIFATRRKRKLHQRSRLISELYIIRNYYRSVRSIESFVHSRRLDKRRFLIHGYDYIRVGREYMAHGFV